jgi:hypothetical protein
MVHLFRVPCDIPPKAVGFGKYPPPGLRSVLVRRRGLAYVRMALVRMVVPGVAVLRMAMGVLAVRELQRAGKRPVSARDFANAVRLDGMRFGA